MNATAEPKACSLSDLLAAASNDCPLVRDGRIGFPRIKVSLEDGVSQALSGVGSMTLLCEQGALAGAAELSV